MIIRYKLITVIIYHLFFSLSSWADSPITINATIDKPRVTTGDIVTYSISLRHDIDLNPSIPDFSIIEGFDIVESQISKPKKLGIKIHQGYSVKLRADLVGIYTIPRIPIPFKVITNHNGESIPGEIRTPELVIEVLSVLNIQGNPTDIRGIKDIVEVDRNWAPWIFGGLNFLLLIIVLFLIWRYRKVDHKPSIDKSQDLLIHEAALQELDILKQKKFLARGETSKHFFELSEIFRRYLGKRYQFPSPDWTTEEITKYFNDQSKLEPKSCSEVIRILNKSDLIKFAKAQVPSGNDEIESVRKLIISTRENTNLGLYSN